MSINPSDSIPPSQMKQFAEQLRQDYQQDHQAETQQSINTKFSKSPTTFNAADEQAFQYRAPSDFTNTRDYSSPRGASDTNNNTDTNTNQLNQSSENTARLILQHPPINPIGQLSVGERQPETNNMLPELSQQRLSELPTSQDIPRNPIGQLADGEIIPNTDSNINTDAKPVRTAPPTHPIAQGIISDDDPIRLRDTAHPSVNFDDVAARQSGSMSPRKRDRDLTPNEKLDIGGPSAMVTEEHMTEGSESPSTAAKLKAKVEVTKEKLKGKVEDWKEERQAKEEEKKRRKEYRDVVGESDPSLGDRIREKWEDTKHKIGDKIDELKDRHEEKKRIKERERELKEADHMTSDRGQI